MNITTTSPATQGHMMRQGALVLAGVMLITLGAKVQVPMYPVPMTLQMAAILLIALTYRPGTAVGTIFAYLALGIAGIPVFAGAGAGPVYMMGPTGGYLAGYLAAAAFIAWAQPRRLLDLLMLSGLGSLIILFCGLVWLQQFYGGDWNQAWYYGGAPFMLGDICKVVLAALAAYALRPHLPVRWFRH